MADRSSVAELHAGAFAFWLSQPSSSRPRRHRDMDHTDYFIEMISVEGEPTQPAFVDLYLTWLYAQGFMDGVTFETGHMAFMLVGAQWMAGEVQIAFRPARRYHQKEGSPGLVFANWSSGHRVMDHEAMRRGGVGDNYFVLDRLLRPDDGYNGGLRHGALDRDWFEWIWHKESIDNRVD